LRNKDFLNQFQKPVVLCHAWKAHPGERSVFKSVFKLRRCVHFSHWLLKPCLTALDSECLNPSSSF